MTNQDSEAADTRASSLRVAAMRQLQVGSDSSSPPPTPYTAAVAALDWSAVKSSIVSLLTRASPAYPIDGSKTYGTTIQLKLSKPPSDALHLADIICVRRVDCATKLRLQELLVCGVWLNARG